jgi:nondiscriminating aspartyl-tRNA synthetase
VTNYFDLLCREAEIVSGGQRIHEHDMMEDSLRLKGLNPDDFRDYLAIFKFGMPKHGGFGMGMERLTMLLAWSWIISVRLHLFPSDTKTYCIGEH